MERLSVNEIRKSHETEEERAEILQKMLDKLPPIVAADLGDCYEVLDGNHRAEAARLLDEEGEDYTLNAIIVPNEVYAYAEEKGIEQMSLAAAAYKKEGFEEEAEKALEVNGIKDEMEEALKYWGQI